MAFHLEDRIRERATTEGTGDFTLLGAVRAHFDFASAYAIGDTLDYVIEHQTVDEVEIGTGTYSAADTLTRTTVIKSSNANALVDFSEGTKHVFVTVRKGRFDGSVPCASNTVTASGLVTGSAFAFLDSGGDHTVTLDTASNESANRTITCPALGGNFTLAFIDLAQTFTVKQTFQAPDTSTLAIAAKAAASMTGPVVSVQSSSGADQITLGATGNVTLNGELNVASTILIQQPAGAFPSSSFDTYALFLRTDGSGSFPFNNAGSIILRPRVSSTAGRSSFYVYTGSSSLLAFEVNEVQQLVHHGGVSNGQKWTLKVLTESLTIAAAATTDTAFSLPANAVILAVSVRVTTAIPTAATFTVTGATSGTAFNTAAVATAANTTDKGTAAGAYANGAAQKVRITPNAVPAAATGVVRVTAHYYEITAPTS